MKKINTSPEALAEARAVLEFWFVETEPRSWFKKNPDFDETVRGRFAEVYRRATTAHSRSGGIRRWAAWP